MVNEEERGILLIGFLVVIGGTFLTNILLLTLFPQLTATIRFVASFLFSIILFVMVSRDLNK